MYRSLDYDINTSFNYLDKLNNLPNLEDVRTQNYRQRYSKKEDSDF